MCNEDTTQTTTFYIVASTFIHTIYILHRQQLVHRLEKALISQCTNETTQAKHEHNPNNPNSLSTTQKNYETDSAQQKQRKQLISTNSKNVFTLCFQPIQRLQHSLITVDIINSWHNRNNSNNSF